MSTLGQYHLPLLHRKFVGKMSANSRTIIQGFKTLIPCPIAVVLHSGFGPLVTGYGVTKTVFDERVGLTPFDGLPGIYP